MVQKPQLQQQQLNTSQNWSDKQYTQWIQQLLLENKKDRLSGEERVLQSFTLQTTGWNIISVCMQLLEISPHKCLVSCLGLHLKAGLRPARLCNSLPGSYRTFLVNPEEGRTLFPSTTGAVMEMEMPVLRLKICLSLPSVLSTSLELQQRQRWSNSFPTPNFFWTPLLLLPTTSFQQLKLWKQWMSSTSVTHFSCSLQLLLSQMLLLLKDKCTHGCCSKKNMQIHYIWQAT